MNDQERWKDVVRSALERAWTTRSAPVPGAVLRILIGRVAVEQGLQYPPNENVRFREFIDSFPEEATIIERKGEDFLVVRPGTDHSLADAETPKIDRQVRADLFRALSHIDPTQLALYDPERDRVAYYPATGDIPPTLVPFPVITNADEVELRRQFANAMTVDEQRDKLLLSLNEEQPLSAFSKIAHQLHLKPAWQRFRARGVLARLESWTKVHNIALKDEWFLAADKTERKTSPVNASAIQHAFVRLILSLDESDIARINIPADLLFRIQRQS